MDRMIRFPVGLATAVAVALWANSLGGRDVRAQSFAIDAFIGVRSGQEPTATDSARRALELTPSMADVEIERRINALQTDVLATRSTAIQWWLTVMALILTFFGIAVPVFSFLGFNRFREIERDTRLHAEAVAQAAESVRSVLIDRDMAPREWPGHRMEALPVSEIAGTVAVSSPGTACSGPPHDGDSPLAHLTRGSTMADMGRHDEAIAEYDEAIRLGGGVDGTAHHNRGASCVALGRYQEAIADYGAAIRLDPMDAGAYAMRGFAKAELGRTEDAIADYDKSIQLQPSDVFTFLNRGRARWESGRHGEAISDFDMAIRMEPEEGGTWLARAIVKREAGMQKEARSDMDSALALAKDAGDQALVDKVESLLLSWRA